ncbi:hypothetical protein HMPREF2826_08765 [Olsenella sp. HMSC062G07]|nr:hypothetical protein HMPREF2826_08765 [Olsenella sp. HMSC062G07]
MNTSLPPDAPRDRPSARGRCLSAFWLELLRSIRGSLGRFLAILGIVALGCGFFAGLQMAGSDMRLAADRYYDATCLWDLRVISTLGLGDADVLRLGQIEGVTEVMASRSVDAMAQMADEQVAVRITSLGEEDAEKDRFASVSASRVNRLVLREGGWPTAANECVISADVNRGVSVGDTIRVLYGSSALDDLLQTRSYTVVGTVSSSDNVYTSNFGSTNLGAGKIDDYLYVPDGAFKHDAAYTVAYLKVAGAQDLQSGSDAYRTKVGSVKERIEQETDALASGRREDLRKKAQAELDDEVATYWHKHDEAYDELAASKRRLDEAEAQIADGQAQLDAGQREYDAGVAELRSRRADAERQLADGQAQLDARRAEWRRGVDELLNSTQTSSLEEARERLEGQAAQVDAALAQLAGPAERYDEVSRQLQQLEAATTALQKQIDALEASGAADPGTLAALRQQLAELMAQCDAARQALDALRPAKERHDALQAQAAQIREALDGAQNLIDGAGALDAAQRQLDDGGADARRAIASGQARLDAAADELARARARLSAARAQLEDGRVRYDDGKAEADERFATAWQQIQDAQRKIDDIGLPDVYVLDRTQSESAATYQADTERMDHIANVFPLIFFLVAALVALTTMTRMVEDDRVQIGTYKALGYGKAAIASKYLIYAAAAAGLGAVVGILVLSQVLPRVVTVAYSIIYAVPLMAFPLPVSLPVALMAGGLGVGVTLLATWAAAYSTLREAPATLMLPRAPKAGKRILLENVGPVWRRLSFSWKVTFRNLFRYKRRLLMTVIGISGCTALLLVGFGMRDSIWDIIDLQFGSIVHYDTTVGLTTDATEFEVADVSDYLRSTGSVSDQVRVQQENMQASGTGASTSATSTTATTVVIPQDSAALPSAVSLRDRVKGSQVPFDDDAVVVSEKLAALHGVKVGDSIVLYDQDDVGNAVGDGHALTVTGIAENYVRNYVYVGREAWKGVSDVVPTFSTIWCNIPDASARAGISSRLHDLGDVSTVIFSNEIIDQYRHMLTAVNMVVVVLIVSAASLAFIVLYNLTNINVDERVREIASLKVLGFTRREVYAYVFREIILLTLIGDAVGLALGVFLERFVITTAEVDYVMFGRTIHLPSFAFAFVLTLVFSGVVMLIMRHKLDRIDMVESLKSVE